MFPSSVQRTYGSKKKAAGADAPGSVLKPSQPLDLSVFSPSPSPPKPVAFTSARKKAAAPRAPKADGASGSAVMGTARKAKAPGTASKPFAGTGWASAIKAPAPTAAAGKGKGNGGGGTVIKRRYAGTRTPLRPLAKEDLFAAANEPDPLELDEPPPLQLTKPPMPGEGFGIDLGASASSLSSSQGSAGSLSSASSPPLDAGASGGSGGSGGSDQSRRAKRGVPGSPREESTSQAKTTRLFSPVVKKPPAGRSAQPPPPPMPMPAPSMLGRPPISTSFLGGIGTSSSSHSLFTGALVMPTMPAPALPPQPQQQQQQRRFSRRLSAARGAVAAMMEEDTSSSMATEDAPAPAPAPVPVPAPAPEEEVRMAVTATPRVMRESARRAMAALTGGGKESSKPASSSSLLNTASRPRRGANSGSSTPRAPRSASKSRPLPGSAIKAPSGASASLEYQSLFAEAEEADLLFLAEEVKRTPAAGGGEDASWLFGFGKGFVLFLPSSWSAARRARVRCLLLQLGFQGQTNGGRIYYRTAQQRVTELRRELARWRALQDETFAAATAAPVSASASFLAVRAEEKEREQQQQEAAAEAEGHVPLPEPPAPAPMTTLRRSSRRLTGAWRSATAAAAAADSEDDEKMAEAQPPPALTATGRKPRAAKAAGGTTRKASSSKQSAAGRRSATAAEIRKALASSDDGEEEQEPGGGVMMEVVEDEEVGGVVQSLGALALGASGGSLSSSQASAPPTQPAPGGPASPVAVEAATQKDGGEQEQQEGEEEEDGMLGKVHLTLRGRNSITFRDPRPAVAEDKDTSIMSWASLSLLSDGPSGMAAAGGAGAGGRPSGDSFIIRSRFSNGGGASPNRSINNAISPPLSAAVAPAPGSGGSSGARTPTQMDVQGAVGGAGAAGPGAHAHGYHHQHAHGHGHGVATFETPMGGKRRDWGVSARANTDSITRLTLRFESAAAAAADGADYSLLPSHMRYGMRSPPALALAAVVAASHAPSHEGAADEDLVAETLLSRRRSSFGGRMAEHVAEMVPAAIAEGDEEEQGEDEMGAVGQEEHPSALLNASTVSLGLGVSLMEDDAAPNSSRVLLEEDGAAAEAAAAAMAAREANLLKRRRRSEAKARRVSMGLMARASFIRQQHGAGMAAAAAVAPTAAAVAAGSGAVAVAGAGGAGHPRRPRNSRLSLCSAMGGLSLTVNAAADRRRSSRMPFSPLGLEAAGAATLPAPRISEGGEGEEEDDGSVGGGAAMDRSRALSLSFIPPLPGDESMLAAEEDGEASMMMQVVPSSSSGPALPPASPKGIEKIAGDLTAACLEFLPVSALTARVDGPAFVCRAWATAALYAQAKVYSDFEAASATTDSAHDTTTYRVARSKKPRADLVLPWSRVARAFPFGQFLSDGAYKQVFRVWAAGARRLEALSVMDVNAITETGNAAILAQELRASILMSALVRHRICPNHVETYGVLRTKHAPSDIWSCEAPAFDQLLQSQQQPDSFGPRPPTAKAPSRAALARGDYQLIRMELCRHGDLEAFLRRQPEGLVSPALTRLLLFQMCFALYAARDAHAMRHYDVKLLNFLLADFAHPAAAALEEDGAISAAMATASIRQEQQQQQQEEGVVAVRYGLGPHVYRLPLPAERALCVKLADFGTADLVQETLGQPVGLDQFTTLENTPVDFLVEGDKATQGYAADAFSLGLAALHLFTGAAPYEEVLEECLCPKELRDALARVWRGASFSVLRRVLEVDDDDEDDEEEEEGGMDATLFHTFYRFLVLLGLPSEEDMLQGSTNMGSKRLGPVWRAVTALIGPDPSGSPSETAASSKPTRAAAAGRKAPGAKERVTARYWADHARFSLARGTQPLVARGRARLLSLPGAMPLLLSLLDYVPSRRPTMYAALSSPLFAGLREGAGPAGEEEEEEDGLSFMAYFRGVEGEAQQQQQGAGGGLVLPPVREDI